MEQDIFKWVLGTLLTIISGITSIMWSKISRSEEEIKNIQITLPTVYAVKSDLNARLDKQDLLLQKILDKIDTKEDKVK